MTPLIDDLEIRGSTLRVSWPASLRTLMPRDLVISWPTTVDLQAIPRPLLIGVAAYAAAPVAWAAGGSWTVPGMERRMAASLEPLHGVVARMIPGHAWPGRVETPDPVEVPASGAGPTTALLFTTGVDSTHEAILEPGPLLLISAVLDDDDDARTAAQMAEAARFAARFEHHHLQARTSIRSMLDRAALRTLVPVVQDWWPEVAHGMDLAAVATPIAWLHGADRLLVSSSDLPPFASVGGTDEHLVKLLAAGPAIGENRALGVSRMSKIATLIAWSDRVGYRPWFRICVRPAPPGQPNCGACERCLRTQVCLVLAGGDARVFGWPDFDDALLGEVVETFPTWSRRLDRGAVALQWQAVADHVRSHPRPSQGPGEERLRSWLLTMDFTPYGRGGPLAGKRTKQRPSSDARTFAPIRRLTRRRPAPEDAEGFLTPAIGPFTAPIDHQGADHLGERLGQHRDGLAGLRLACRPASTLSERVHHLAPPGGRGSRRPGAVESPVRGGVSVPVNVAIVVVSYNALPYARRMLRSVRRTVNVPISIVVVDNDSRLPTRLFWMAQRLLGRITRLAFLDRNTFFAEGCNIGVAMAPRDATHVLLLNTDCEVRDARWLERLLAVHEAGATGLGHLKAGPWPRADGFCLLVDRACWGEGLDESYQWWWSVTGLEARLLREGHTVTAVRQYADALVHHGGKSGRAFTAAHSGDTSPDVIAGWFDGHQVRVVERLPDAR